MSTRCQQRIRRRGRLGGHRRRQTSEWRVHRHRPLRRGCGESRSRSCHRRRRVCVRRCWSNWRRSLWKRRRSSRKSTCTWEGTHRRPCLGLGGGGVAGMGASVADHVPTVGREMNECGQRVSKKQRTTSRSDNQNRQMWRRRMQAKSERGHASLRFVKMGPRAPNKLFNVEHAQIQIAQIQIVPRTDDRRLHNQPLRWPISDHPPDLRIDSPKVVCPTASAPAGIRRVSICVIQRRAKCKRIQRK